MKTLLALVLALSTSFAVASDINDYYEDVAEWNACGGSGTHFSGGGNCGPAPVYKANACPSVYFGDGSNGTDCTASVLPTDPVLDEDGALHLLDVKVGEYTFPYVKLQWNGEAFSIEKVSQ